MVADFYGKVLVEPTKVRHPRPELEVAISQARHAAEKHRIEDLVVANGVSPDSAQPSIVG
jgi:hypothetical protein